MSSNQYAENSPLLKGEIVSVPSDPPPPYTYSSINNQPDDPEDKRTTITHNIQVYKRRWYVLLIFSCFGACQNLIWNAWGPVSDSAKDAFDWNDGDIALLSNWGPIAYLISGIFFSWMIGVKGLRIACTSSSFLVALGAGLRCFTSTPPLSTWLIHAGQFLNGLGGPVAMTAPPVISAIWFPPKERTTATSIAFLIPNILGVAGAFLIGPLLVPSHSTNTHNTSHINISDKVFHPEQWLSNDINSSTNSSRRITAERKHIMFLMYVECAAALLVFLMMLIYFPKKPPLPPCASATIKRQDFWKGLKDLFKCGQFWYVAIAYGISTGVCNCWASVLNVNLSPLGISQDESGWIGFYATCAACVASLVIARFADIFSKRLKLFVFILYAIGAAFIAWFALAADKILPTSTVVMYVTVIISIMMLNAAIPLLYELACELAYPIGEGTTNGVVTILNNLSGLIFLFILMVPDIGTRWMSWTLLGVTVACFPLFAMLKETYHRLEIDENQTVVDSTYIVPDPIQ
ncbi:solute carrier family 49 member 4 [Patella vulgata]|uniref:solute carrier family 49 member 4 n=1 Tax=Patella vulgata TaxID=6465 RepID=UPI0024A9521B|nr:solute carrier family 49 member 4 [Patella vulgata]